MSLIVEDGTGKVDAQAYIDAAYLDQYASLRGEDLTAYDEAQKEAAIYIATNDYIDVMYSFIGDKINAEQALSLPTSEVDLTVTATLKAVQEANANGAILQLKGKLLVNPEDNTSSGTVKAESSKLDVIEESFEYFEGSRREVRYPTPIIDRLLSPFTGGYGVQLKVT